MTGTWHASLQHPYSCHRGDTHFTEKARGDWRACRIYPQCLGIAELQKEYYGGSSSHNPQWPPLGLALPPRALRCPLPKTLPSPPSLLTPMVMARSLPWLHFRAPDHPRTPQPSSPQCGTGADAVGTAWGEGAQCLASDKRTNRPAAVLSSAPQAAAPMGGLTVLPACTPPPGSPPGALLAAFSSWFLVKQSLRSAEREGTSQVRVPAVATWDDPHP
jgi:hypothetical protein